MKSSSKEFLSAGGLEVDVVFKNIKNLHISVYPPFGSVRVAAPLNLNEDAVRRAVVQRLPWIKRKRANYLEVQRQPQREMKSGESHLFAGKRYQLEIQHSNASNSIEIRGKKLVMSVKSGLDRQALSQKLNKWYRRELVFAAQPYLIKWSKILGVPVPQLYVKDMKTKWGTYSSGSGRVWINLEMAKKPLQCLEYLIVHELIHTRIEGHGEAFQTELDRYMPNWRRYRNELNTSPLKELSESR